MTESVNVGEWSGLADAASSPRQTAAAATAAASPAPAAATTAAASAAPAPAAATAAAAAATAAAPPSYLYAALGLRGVLLVEDIEGRQTDVGDFLFTERECLAR